LGNRTLAAEWLTIAWHDLRSAQILYEAGHYTDSIGCDLQQALEKMLKSLIAYENRRIPRSHDLIECYAEIQEKLPMTEEELDFLTRATTYLQRDRYPNPNYSLPPRTEIEKILHFSQGLFEKILKELEIDQDSLNA
jgi:HEPN domain-containing protein